MANSSFFLSPPDNTCIRDWATLFRPKLLRIPWMYAFFGPRAAQFFSLYTKHMCSYTVRNSDETSNCGIKLDRSAISVCRTSDPFSEMVPDIFPRSLCEIAANNVVLPDPLRIHTKCEYYQLFKNGLYAIPWSDNGHQLSCTNRSGYYIYTKQL